MGKFNSNINVRDISILSDLVGSDHLPMIANLVISDVNMNNLHFYNASDDNYYIDWKCISDNDL